MTIWRHRGQLAVFGGLLLFGCGKTAIFGVEPGDTIDDPIADATSRPEDGGPDPRADTGPDGGMEDFGVRPDFPDVGFPDLPCDGCDEIRAILDNRRWELPCEDDGPTVLSCRTELRRRQVTNLRGLPGSVYEVRLRFRGVVEQHEYVGGYSEGRGWNTGGVPRAGGTRNIFVLELTDPAQTFYLNDGSEGAVTVGVDYQISIRFSVGGQVEFRAESLDEVQTKNRGSNGRPVVIPGVEPFPESFDGQFIQMNVVDVRRIR